MEHIDELSIATLRSLVIDTTNKANSGHPGMALGSAPLLYTLFKNHFVSDPTHPEWINRDRFVLSAGHASALLYSMLHLCNYDLTIDDLKQFRQLNSKTPGHPEYGWTKGVDATSGPLGQGISQAVGLAMAETFIAANYPEGEKLSFHYTYCLCGDGCMQEGVTQEAISLAGHQKLNRLILFYDANQVTLDGSLDLSFSEAVKERFKACAWDVLEVADGNDIAAIDQAIAKAKLSKEKPTLIIVTTVIGYGASKQGTSKVHGSPIGYEDGKRTKVQVYHFDHEDFYVPTEVYQDLRYTFVKRGQDAYQAYQKTLQDYASEHEKEAEIFNKLLNNDVTSFLPKTLPDFVNGSQLSTRAASGKALNFYQSHVPMLFGGSADVAGSVMTKLDNGVNYTPETRFGHNMNFGIREFAMAGIQNGMLLHGGVRTYVGCFFVFVDYLKPALRLAALSELPAIYLLSHDSVALGEDGPTHQPIEQLAMLRSIPNVHVMRPADERETYACWEIALSSLKTPTALVTSRQNLPLIETSSLEGTKKGAYIIGKERKNAALIFIATGSEVSLALEAQKMLWEKGVDTRVVSMPCWELFARQSASYQQNVLSLPRKQCISVEMLSTFGWDRYAKYQMGIDTFGVSAPIKDVIKHFDFTAEHLVNLALSVKK